MDLILCHSTADFDTLGAAVGMTLLYPGARIVLTGGEHPGVRRFLALHRDAYPLIERKAVVTEEIRRLIVVDAQSRDRIGKAADWIDLPQLEAIQIYDHHLGSSCDIPAQVLQVEPVGATTTLVVEQLKANEVEALDPFTATVMALGIHADTGSLTYDHSTPRDAEALAWLMAQGANVGELRSYIEPGYSEAVQALLAEALGALESEDYQGHKLSKVLLSTPDYLPGLAGLTSELLEITGSDVMLLGTRYPAKGKPGAEERLSLIGRASLDGLDLGQLLRQHGGGGHSKAASASLKAVDATQVMDELWEQIKQQIPEPLTARDLMSSPVRTIRPDVTIEESQRLLLRYGHSGICVVNEADELIGIISRRDLDLALHHGFSQAPVKGYMSRKLKTIEPQTGLPEIERLMVTYDVGRLPVLRGGDLLGIVTRTDVLRTHYQAVTQAVTAQGLPSPGLTAQESELNQATERTVLPTPLAVPIDQMLKQRLQSQLWELLEDAAREAEAQGWHLYLVGGGVRDLLLSDPRLSEIDQPLQLSDIDLIVDGFHQSVTEAAGVELAQALLKRYPQARLEVHGKFQTAALLWHRDDRFGNLGLDIATARTEFYPYPAANPVVEASSVRQDLYRRDFTINALAMQLTEPRAGQLLDYFGGQLDLGDRRIRVLHANSFIEDPTRIYRAVRFAVRLGFELEEQTRDYITYALESGVYERTQGENPVTPALQTRLRAELEYILEAPYWQPALRLLGELEALKCIHHSLKLTPQLWRRIRLVDRALAEVAQPPTASSLTPWLLRLEIILADLAPELRAGVARKLQLPADSIDRLDRLADEQQTVHGQLEQAEQPSQVYDLLCPFEIPSLILIAAATELPQRKQLWCYLTRWILVKPPLNGNDLKQLGYKPGKQFKLMLDELRRAALDGAISRGEAGLAEAKAYLEQHYPLLLDEVEKEHA